MMEFRSTRPDGGYRPSPDAVQEWLKQFHPEHEGKTYSQLPKELQKEFRSYVPPLDPEMELEALRARWRCITEPLGEELESKSFVALNREETETHMKLFFDAYQSFKTQLDKMPKGKKQ